MPHNDLDAAMEFDHVIEVMPDGSFRDANRDPMHPVIHAPESLIETDDDGQILQGHEDTWRESLKRQGWDTFTDGYSGQYRYSGPIMHASEFIGGALKDDILEQPGLYVSVVVTCLPYGDDENAETEDAGWAVLYREHYPSPNGHRVCICCGDDAAWHDEDQPVCKDCVTEGCEMTTDAGGEWGWWNCQRTDSQSAREAMAREIRINFAFFREEPQAAFPGTARFVRVLYAPAEGEDWQLLVGVRFYDLLPSPYWAVSESGVPAIPVQQKKHTVHGRPGYGWQELMGNLARTMASDDQTGPLGDALEDALKPYQA